uniref:Tr-type G domain-containing protein n=1 Tax=Lotharella oceanica TaxID=641309 RepID=A0A7S2TLP9_9EUKA|mmetsp:Transcript_20104/g.37777  ORF Transcript_20104/g.37777 Transcript_20104/m.37777 type:complete len:430 (+) Transcript_20104:325-1614(+)
MADAKTVPSAVPNLNVAIIGHVAAGKSTLAGQLILRFGGVDSGTLDEYRAEAERHGKGSDALAWILNNLRVERETGRTQENSLFGLNLDENSLRSAGADRKGAPAVDAIRRFTFIDSPGECGHAKQIHNALSQADAALLVISAVPGEFENALSQFQQHTTTAIMTGVKSYVVAVNKMDHPTVAYSASRFDEIRSYLKSYFEKRLRASSAISYIPISASKPSNLLSSPRRTMPWYSGSTLVASLAALRIHPRRSHAQNASKSLRVAIQRVFRVHGAGTVATGRVERGTLRVGQKVVIAPRGLKATITSIEAHYVAKQAAGPGENVGFALHGVARCDVHSGDVVGDAEDNPPKEVKSFLAHMAVTNQPHSLREGATHMLDCHSAHVPVKLQKIHSRLMGKDGTSKDLKVVDVEPKVDEAHGHWVASQAYFL